MAQQSVLEQLKSYSGVARKRHLRRYVLDVLHSIVDEQDSIDGDAHFMDLSSDSLKAVELKQQLERDLGLKLRSTLLFDHPTPNALCDHLYERLENAAPPPPQQVEAARASETRESGDPGAEPIAIVGASCRFPGRADNLEAYWKLLHEGRDAIEHFDADTLGPRKRVTSLLDTFPPFGGLISEVDAFDARLFGISPKEAVDIDPQQRVLMQVCWEALENAHIPPRVSHSGMRRDVAVFVATRGTEYHEETLEDGDPAYHGTGASVASLAGRVAHGFGFSGAAVTLDTACSGSLVALHYAVQELRRGDCSAALAAGVNLLVSGFASRATHAAKMLAPDGRCKAFSARANGYVRSEGCAVVVLKRLRDAVTDGDAVLGVIRGSAVNQDGMTSGLTVPSGAAQQEVIRRALENARVDAGAISYVECHGTGTELGDPIEVQALSEALGAPRRLEPLCIGSVKSQIGHAEPAAGLAGVLKVLLAMRRRSLPATLHCKGELNPYVDWKGLNVLPTSESRAWPSHAPVVLAGVSSFGFTGTNAHVILASAQAAEAEAEAPPASPWSVLTLSAAEPEALGDLETRWSAWLAGRSMSDVDAACRASNTGRAPLPYRRAFRAASPEGLVAAIQARKGSRAERKEHGPVAIALLGDAAALERVCASHRGSWPALDEALETRTAAIEAATGVSLRADPRSSRQTELRGLAAACALGDALIALGLAPEQWVGEGIGAFAAHVLTGTSLDRAVAAIGFGGVLESSSVLALSEGTAAQLGAREIRHVVAAGAGRCELLPGALWLSEERDSLGSLTGTLFEEGHDLRWDTVRSPCRARALDLPTYPFRKTAFWRPFDGVTRAARVAEAPAASMVSELYSPAFTGGERVFRIELDPLRLPFLRDHVVESVPVLPAAGLLEVLRRVGQTLLGNENVGVEALSLERAILVSDRHQNLQVVARPAAAPARAGFDLEVSSARPDAPTRFSRHARARIVSEIDAGGLQAAPVVGEDAGTEFPLADLYAQLEQAGVRHGPEFRAITRLTTEGDRAEVEVRVPSEREEAWGPIGVDACFIASAALLSVQGDRVARLPSGCARAVFYGPPRRAVRASVRLLPNGTSSEVRVDVAIFDADRRPVATVGGLALTARDRSAAQDVSALRAQPFTWTARELPLDSHAGPSRFHVVADDLLVSERLCSVLRSVHKLDARSLSLVGAVGAAGAAGAVGADATSHLDTRPDGDVVHHVVLANYRLSGPSFLEAALPLVRSLGAPATPGGKTHLWIVTSGVFSTAANAPQAFRALSRAAVWGFGRSLQQEMPSLACTLLDVDAAITVEAACELLASEFRRNRRDAQVRYVEGTRQTPLIGAQSVLPARLSGPVELKRDASYLITGGAGDLGRVVAEQLAVAGAGHIILASRRPRELDPLVARIESLGTEVSIWELDVADRRALETQIERLRGPSPMHPPLRGIVHLAGVLADRTIESIAPADLTAAFAPKVDGTWNLHELTADLELDFFIGFSSLASALGSPGQACYAGGNAFIDALTEARQRAGLPATSLQWGPWARVGMAARQLSSSARSAERLARLGIDAIPLDDAVDHFKSALHESVRGVVLVAKMNWTTYARELLDPRLRALLPLASAASDADEAGSEAGALREELRALANERPEAVVRRLDAYIRERVMAASGSQALSEHDSFFELGLDSLQAVSIRARIERDLAVSLAPSAVFDYPTLATLRDHLLYDHLGAARPRAESSFATGYVPMPAATLAAPVVAAPPPTHLPVTGASPPAPERGRTADTMDAAALLAELELGLSSLERELGQ